MSHESEQFPRELKKQEKYLLFSILPENKPGYKIYRDKINELFITGYGKFRNNNFILGKKNTTPDFSFSSPVFASGTVKIPDDEIDILINEEMDNEIEIDLSLKNTEVIPENILELKKWSYSNWNPGDKSPGDLCEVREVIISRGNYTLVFAPTHKKIWLHENVSGVNYIIPLTNYYNELMRFRKIKDPKAALNPGQLFEMLIDFSDNDLINALVLYNKYMRRFSTDFSKYLVQPLGIVKKSFIDIFRKGKN